MKASKYYTKFKISEQRGSFQGIDTYSITNFGGFGFTSVLLYEYESRSIATRPDINNLLLKLQIEIYLSIDSVNAMLARAKFLHLDLSEFDNYLNEVLTHLLTTMLTRSLLVDHLSRIKVVLDYHHSNNNNNPTQ